MGNSTHECPAPGCARRVTFSQLACKTHWYQIPKRLRDEVWHAYRRHGQGSRQHAAAVDAAVTWLHEGR